MTMNKFRSDGMPKGGRPIGARTKLTARVFQDILKSWTDPAAPNSPYTVGEFALECLRKEKPGEYVMCVLSVLPKELTIESAMGDVSDSQLDELVHKIREHLLTARTKRGDEDKEESIH
jgi:hypothetical protein